MRTLKHLKPLSCCLAAFAAWALLFLAPPFAAADDRELLRTGTGSPYVFIVFDSSGSMNWAPKCTQAQFDADICDYLCPTGDCPVPRDSDDPASKFRQAKEALHEVLATIPSGDVFFGFASYNQDRLGALNKHWLFQVQAGQPALTLAGGDAFPAAGALYSFGEVTGYDCLQGGSQIGCYPHTDVADTDDAWEMTRVGKVAKLDDDNDTTVALYVRSGGRIYRVDYAPTGGAHPIGTLATETVSISVGQCIKGTINSADDCDQAIEISPLPGSPIAVTFDRVGDYLQWDFQAGRTPPQNGYGLPEDSTAGGTCEGMDINTDSSADKYPNTTATSYSARFPTIPADCSGIVDPAAGLCASRMTYGDQIPLDWRADNRQLIMDRLFPAGQLGENPADPLNNGFAVARYFNEQRCTGPNAPYGTCARNEGFLRLRDESLRPLVANGSTPLGFAIADFRTWWAGCEQGACTKNTGFKDLAIANDPDWNCRRKYLLVITDGDDTCPGRDPCSFTAALRAQESILTYVVAFGVENTSGNRLNCMASNGGTGEPIYPQNKQELVEALLGIFSQIKEDSAAFASAAVPSVQAQVADKIYLSNFNPLNFERAPDPDRESIWVGHVDTYLKPLPLTAAKVPDKTRVCGGTVTRNCFLWDVAVEMLPQAPVADDILADNRHLGLGPLERRVFYGVDGTDVPRARRLFDVPTATADKYDLWTGMGISFIPGDVASENTAAAQAEGVIDFTLVQKQGIIDRADGTTENITYVLGDIFHSNPIAVGNPNSFRYFAANLYTDASALTTCTSSPPDRGYRCFFARHRCRRKILTVGANDGQLHAFDSGIFRPSGDATCNPEPKNGTFDNGTGREIFSYIPRASLPILRGLSTSDIQDWSVDGTAVADDVFIDPIHTGIPDPDQREWRTLLTGGMREGGRFYYALDITQPDSLDATTFVPTPANGYVPSCAGDSPPADCGGLPYPSILWEYNDAWDEDPVGQLGHGFPDMGDTWSIPNTGRIRVCEGVRCDPASLPNDLVDKFVVVVGGGMDPSRGNSTGNWLYMIDVETGKAIYKRRLDGSAPSEPAAVDTNQDGYFDTIYIGTTRGFLYKVSMTSPAVLADTTVTDYSTGVAVSRTVKRVTDAAWEPFPIFDTLNVATGARLPIYYPPTVLFVGRLARFALAFGDGDREDLWLPNSERANFYTIVDDDFTASMVATGDLPKTTLEYERIPAAFTGTPDRTLDFLNNPRPGMERGWYIELEPGERVITKAFSLSGIVVFSSYQPRNIVAGTAEEPVCSRGGDSRLFTVVASNANPVQKDPTSGAWTLYRSVPEFVTDPFTEQSGTQNVGPNGANADQLTDELIELMEELKRLFSPLCKFGYFRIDIKTVRSDTGLEFIAPVPVCIVEKTWKEF